MVLKIVLAVIGLGLFFFLLGKFIKHRSLYPFMPFRYDFRKRRNMFRRVLGYLDRMGARTIVETGTSREGLRGSKSNGAATLVFGKWALQNGAKVHSVDISEQSISRCRDAVQGMGLEASVLLHQSDSVSFLEGFSGSVDLLYLDSYDYSNDPAIQRASQEHHLAEIQAIESQLHPDSLVLIDDCDLPGGGKGKLAIAYLLERGWKILFDEYQVLLARTDGLFGKIA